MLLAYLHLPVSEPRDVEQIVDQSCHVQHLAFDETAGKFDQPRIVRGLPQHLHRVEDRS